MAHRSPPKGPSFAGELLNSFDEVDELLAVAVGGAVLCGFGVFRWMRPEPWGQVVFAISLIVLALGGRALGKASLRSEIRAEIPMLLAQIRKAGGSRDMWDVRDSRLFTHAFMLEDPRGAGYVVRFPLNDGSVVEFVSDSTLWAKEGTARCSEELKPGWYRRARCDGD